MSIFFASSEDCDFYQLSGTSVSTNSSRLRSGYARTALGVKSGYQQSDGWKTSDIPGQTDLWLSAQTFFYFYFSDRPLLFFLDSSGTFGFKIEASSSNPPKAFKRSGGSWVQVATGSSPLVKEQIARLVVRIVIGASGKVEVWSAGVKVLDFSGDTTGDISSISAAQLLGTDNSFSSSWSEVVLADEDIRSVDVVTLTPNANGNNTGWTNDYTAVDETEYNDADLVSSGTAGQEQSFGASDLPSTERQVKAVVVGGRGARDTASGPQNMSFGVRTGAANYYGSSFQPETGFTPLGQTVWATNPDTGAEWTLGEVDAAELAVKSEA